MNTESDTIENTRICPKCNNLTMINTFNTFKRFSTFERMWVILCICDNCEEIFYLE